MLALSIWSLLLGWTIASDSFHTGFSYGAFWTVGNTTYEKRYNDFHKGFKLAKTLGGGSVSFNSARLFQTNRFYGGNTNTEPIEAFQAAVDTDTTLLLGIWVGLGGSVQQQLVALDKAFEQHGQKLADLIVGLSVGSEDVYRYSPICLEKSADPRSCDQKASPKQMKKAITSVREHIAKSPYADLWGEKPIGHVEPAPIPILEGLDFIGMTAYPFWNKEGIDAANSSFFSSLDELQGRAGDTPIWIAETGWPFAGKDQGQGVANLGNMQRYWQEVGCSIVGKRNVWWFELVKDSDPMEPYDWGTVSADDRPRIDFSCPSSGDGAPAGSSSIAGPGPSASSSNPAPTPSDSASAVPTTTPAASSTPPPASSTPPPASSSAPLASSSAPLASSSAPLASSSAPSASSPAPAPSSSIQPSADPSTPVQEQPPSSEGSQEETVTVTETQCVTVYSAGNGQMATYTTSLLESGAKGCSEPPALLFKKGETTVTPTVTVTVSKYATPPPASMQSSALLHATSGAASKATAFASVPSVSLPGPKSSTPALQPSAKPSSAEPSGSAAGIGGFTYPTRSAGVKRRWWFW